MCPESNGEAESAVKRVKYAIAHTKSEKPLTIQAAIHNINLAQRLDMSGCAAELFLKRSVRVEGLATIPHHLKEVGLEKRKRSESREKVRVEVGRGGELRMSIQRVIVCQFRIMNPGSGM